MRGQILNFSTQTNTGIITGEDGHHYTFSKQQWKDTKSPAVGTTVDFIINGKRAVDIFIIASRNPIADLSNQLQSNQKNRITAALLALLFGSVGAHKFYLGQISLGIIYLVFFWTFIPAIIAFIEAIFYIITSDQDFTQKYG